jgi:hypothetical protein
MAELICSVRIKQAARSWFTFLAPDDSVRDAGYHWSIYALFISANETGMSAILRRDGATGDFSLGLCSFPGAD